MEPFIVKSSTIGYRSHNPKYIPKLGDIVLIKSHSSPLNTVHRIISIKPNAIYTKGDNLKYADPPRRLSEITGIITHITINQQRYQIKHPILNILNKYLTIASWITTKLPGNITLNFLSRPIIYITTKILTFYH